MATDRVVSVATGTAKPSGVDVALALVAEEDLEAVVAALAEAEALAEALAADAHEIQRLCDVTVSFLFQNLAV